MSFTSIELNASGVDVLMQRTSGSTLSGNGPISQGVFAIDGTGAPYYDTAGPTVGETAVLGFDGAVGELFLDSRFAPDQHLMMLVHALRRTARTARMVRSVRGVPRRHQQARARARSRDAVHAPAPVGDRPSTVGDPAQHARALARAR